MKTQEQSTIKSRNGRPMNIAELEKERLMIAHRLMVMSINEKIMQKGAKYKFFKGRDTV